MNKLSTWFLDYLEKREAQKPGEWREFRQAKIHYEQAKDKAEREEVTFDIGMVRQCLANSGKTLRDLGTSEEEIRKLLQRSLSSELDMFVGSIDKRQILEGGHSEETLRESNNYFFERAIKSKEKVQKAIVFSEEMEKAENCKEQYPLNSFSFHESN